MGAPSPSAVLYAAKSTEDVHGSIPTQLADCRAMAEREGFEVVGEYQDEAASAYTGNRGPGLAAALDHVERIGADLFVQHSDRLARGDGRTARHLAEIFFAARRAGFTLRSVQDDSTFTNPLLAVALGERNAEDSRRKSLAVRAGRRRAWEHGDFPGGRTPDGFQVVSRQPKEVRLDPDRIKVIRLIGELADQGWGVSPIARELNRRGHRTNRGAGWSRQHVHSLITNAIYYGGVMWHRGDADEAINWDTSFPAPWTRGDYERRARRAHAKEHGGRPPGRPNTSHALAGLARCGECTSAMRPITSSYRRKDGSRKRTYVCAHVHESTGLCAAPRIDAEVVDTHVTNELQRYLGDFEAWQNQVLSGYASDRTRLEREVVEAGEALAAQERICERTTRAIGLAENDDETKAAMRADATANRELERRQRLAQAAQEALESVPDEAPTDRMLDYYNELSAAVRGRLDGANAIARVNDALKDIFSGFSLISPPHDLGEGILVAPILRRDQTETRAPELAWVTGPDSWREFRADPPLRTLKAHPEVNAPTPWRSPVSLRSFPTIVVPA